MNKNLFLALLEPPIISLLYIHCVNIQQKTRASILVIFQFLRQQAALFGA